VHAYMQIRIDLDQKEISRSDHLKRETIDHLKREYLEYTDKFRPQIFSKSRKRWEMKRRKDMFLGEKNAETKICWEGLNSYINKLRIPDTKHHKSEIGLRRKKWRRKNFLG
jgi:t-SNARE complex subunit (syntaxin)